MRFLWLLLLLLAAQESWAYIQFQHTLVPFSFEARESVIATQRATFGHFVDGGFHKVARTRELHNCVLPGCSLMGEVLNIRQSNVTAYDPDTLEMHAHTVTNRRGRKMIEREVSPENLPVSDERKFFRFSFRIPRVQVF